RGEATGPPHVSAHLRLLMSHGDRILTAAFFDRTALKIARDLLGCHLHFGHQIHSRIITESYFAPQDLASHASKGRTKRTEAMFGPPVHSTGTSSKIGC